MATADLLEQIRKVMPIEDIINTPVDVWQYYKQVDKHYKKYHSMAGAMHMPLYITEKYGIKDAHYRALLEQAKFIGKQIKRTGAKRILEIGCGFGYNLNHLAQENPGVQFTGLDLSSSHLAFAAQQKKYNINWAQGDFNEEAEMQEAYDLIFAVETFCYSSNLKKNLASLYTLLKPGGQLIIYDMYANKPDDTIALLTAKGLAVEQWQNKDTLQTTAQGIGYKVLEQEDLTKYTLPNAATYERGTANLFRFPIITKLLLKLRIINETTFRHIITLYLTYTALKENKIGYHKTILKK